MSTLRALPTILLSIGVLNCVEVIDLGTDTDEIRCVEDDGATNSCPENFVCVGTTCKKSENIGDCVAEPGECDVLVCGSDSCGEACPEQCGEEEFCSDDRLKCELRYGFSVLPEATDSSLEADAVYGFQISIPEGVELLEFGVLADFYDGVTSPSIQLAIYDNRSNGGIDTPHLRIATSLFTGVSAGSGGIAFGSGDTFLSAGTYWLLLRTGANGIVLSTFDVEPDAVRTVFEPGLGEFPFAFPNTPSFLADEIGMFIVTTKP